MRKNSKVEELVSVRKMGMSFMVPDGKAERYCRYFTFILFIYFIIFLNVETVKNR